MPVFEYKAQGEKGLINERVEALSESDARREIQEAGLVLISIKEVASKNSNKPLWERLNEKKVSVKDLSIMSRQFATLIEAGVPIKRSLSILEEGTPNKTLKEALAGSVKDIESGGTLSTAFAKYPKVFPSIYISMIESAEIGGALAEILDELAVFLEKEKSMKSKIRSAMAYPSVVIVATLIAILVMLVFVVPQFEPLFADLGADLPLPTRMLMAGSELAQTYWWLFIILIAGAVVGITFATRTEKGKMLVDQTVLKIPVIKDVILKSSVARFSRTLQTLQKSGVPLVEALTVVTATANNTVIENMLKDAKKKLEDGQGLSEPLSESGIFPDLVVQMITIGEETGELEKMLGKIADFYEEEVDLAVKTLTGTIEPALTLILGVIVGFVAISIIMPIYELMGAMQKQ